MTAEPPPPHSPHGFEQRAAELNRRIGLERAVDSWAEQALESARRYAKNAERAYGSGHPGQAERVLGAAEALLHVAEHREHLLSGGGPKQPTSDEIQEHLRRVYFRTQQADYFLREAHDRSAAPLPEWARAFYQSAVLAYDRKEFLAADENAKCADEAVKALENMAQAANMP